MNNIENKLDIGLATLSSITIFSKYAKYLPDKKRREDWGEIVDRYENMMIKKYPHLKEEIIQNCLYIRSKKVLPSMRAMQFAGPAMEVNNTRGYNCCFFHVNSVYSFSEAMFLLLGGTGVGYSVQKHHVDQLPVVNKPLKKRNYLVQDSIIGWADAVKALMKSYLEDKALPVFDFRDIRQKGARLITAGGKAPGPEPLKECLFQIQKILDRKENGTKLTPLECHDILCHIANSVLSGGIRRAAMIALFSLEDEEMLTCKFGEWWIANEQRGRANNSAIILRDSISKEEFKKLWHKVELSGSGEPGVYWTNNLEEGTNPCVETALRHGQFCNLSEPNVSDVENQKDLDERIKAAAFFGTLQAGFTDFHYLRGFWKRVTEEDALLGIGMTGICSGKVLKLDLKQAASWAIHENQRVAELIGINPASRVTCVKPSGTTSCVLGTSSGIHAWYAEYYLRTMRFNKNEDIAAFLMVNYPELCEDDELRSHDTICVRIPIKAPAGSILRTESSLDTLERIKKFTEEWVKPGHIKGENSHNISATISIDKERSYTVSPRSLQLNGYTVGLDPYNIDEWELVGTWMWVNKDCYNGLSVIPFDNGSYVQPPFEEITKEEYKKRVKNLQELDLSKIVEIDDNINFGQVAACAGGACELTN